MFQLDYNNSVIIQKGISCTQRQKFHFGMVETRNMIFVGVSIFGLRLHYNVGNVDVTFRDLFFKKQLTRHKLQQQAK